MFIFHSYSRIEYQCIENIPTAQPATAATAPTLTLHPTTESKTISGAPRQTTETTSPTTVSTETISFNQLSTSTKKTGSAADTTNESATDVGGIVGGIVGVILVICIIGAVIFFIKRRKADNITSKNVHVNQNGSNRRYQTDTSLPRTTTTPVYYELGKNGNNSRPISVKPTSGDNYDYIGGDNHATGNDNYNHIGINGVTTDDEYHHLKGPNSNKPSVPDSNYNHIGPFSVAEDNYQHIGDNKPGIITEDTYNHIGGHDNTGLNSDAYHHIGGNHEHQVVTGGTYNHIGGDHKEILGNDDYHHIGNGNAQPIIIDGEYSHIGGADVLEGEYSLAKDI
ncbi:uncharacterized protein LOC126810264 [Patella vulgata]|uniref:uncharacterized protein LOC126810264 n=1 Tax=Patella vulgata TaxID=6465 RepID=UPI0021801B98|nr:uncharacterized protein LOC126810264 [Patella vulgata]